MDENIDEVHIGKILQVDLFLDFLRVLLKDHASTRLSSGSKVEEREAGIYEQEASRP